jgi:hypothetical protein
MKEKVMKKIKKFTPDESKANTIMYMVQDMLDDLSSGGKVDLKQFEKEVLKVIRSIRSRDF